MTQGLIRFPSVFDIRVYRAYIITHALSAKSLAKMRAGPISVTRLLRNMAARPDESISRRTNKKRSWKAPERGSSKDETPKDVLTIHPRDDSVLHIDGSVLEGVGHVRYCDGITRPFIRVVRYYGMQ